MKGLLLGLALFFATTTATATQVAYAIHVYTGSAFDVWLQVKKSPIPPTMGPRDAFYHLDLSLGPPLCRVFIPGTANQTHPDHLREFQREAVTHLMNQCIAEANKLKEA